MIAVFTLRIEIIVTVREITLEPNDQVFLTIPHLLFEVSRESWAKAHLPVSMFNLKHVKYPG